MRAIREDLYPGKLIGRFLLLQPLTPSTTEAGIPRSYLALDQEIMEVVVLTLSTRPPTADEVGVFEASLQASRGLPSTHLASILDGGQVEDRFFVSSAWVPGIELKNLVPAGGLALDLALPILWVVTSALSTLHGRGLVHGNLHPRNVRITPRGAVVLVGFAPAPVGMPHASRPPDEEAPRYASPEWHRDRTLSATGDVYSLGLLIYELFSGKPLLPPSSEAACLQNQERVNLVLETSPSLSKLVPAAIQPVLREMLRTDVTLRPRSGKDLLDALVRAVPNWATTGSLQRLPLERLQGTFDRMAGALLDRVRAHLDDARPLPAAACLQRAAELLGTCPPGTASRYGALLEESLWYTFQFPASSEQQRTARMRNEALALSLFWASQAVESSGLQSLAAQRLGVFARRDGPLADLLPRPDSPENRERRRKGLAALVRNNPSDGTALLGLASFATGFMRGDGTPVDAMKLGLLTDQDLYGPAIVYRTRPLTDRPATREDLIALRDLAQKALEEMGGPGSAAPEEAPAEAGDDVEAAARPSREDEMVEHLLAASQSAATPSAATAPPPVPDDPTRPLTTAQARSVLDEARGHARGNRFPPLVQALHRLHLGKGIDSRTLGEVQNVVKQATWLALLPNNAAVATGEALGYLAEAARAAGMDAVAPLVERMLFEKLERDDDKLAWATRLLEVTPDSAPCLKAAHEAAGALGKPQEQAGFLKRLGDSILALGAVHVAVPLYQAGRGLAPEDPIHKEALRTANVALEKLPKVAEQFQEIQAKVAAGLDTRAEVALLDEFLGWHPTYLPAAMKRATVALAEGDSATALRLNLLLAKVAFAIEQRDLARDHFRKAMQCEPEHDEAMLFLAYINPLDTAAIKPDADLRIALLVREELPDVAIHHARQKLAGGIGDLLVHEQLADLCRAAGRDPSPHLAAQGFLALQAGERRLARECFEEAIREAPNRNQLIDSLLQTDNIASVFAVSELVGMKS